jgi:tetratricopeptide (TPR) repeat protein
MQPRNVLLAVVSLCTLVGITSIYPKSQSSAQVDVKQAAVQPACQSFPGHFSSQSERNILMKDRPLISIAWYLAAVRQYDQALELVDRVKYCGFKDMALAGVASSMAKEGQIDRALQLTNTIRDHDEKAIVWGSVAEKLVRTGKHDQAIKLVNNTINDDLNKMNILTKIVPILVEAGQIDRALQAANTMKLDANKATVLSHIASTLAEVSKYEQALEIANTIANPDGTQVYKHEAFVNIAVELASSGQIDRALQLVNQLDSYRKGSALGKIAVELASSGQFDRALQLVKSTQSDPAHPIVLARFAESLTDTRQLEPVLQMAKTIEVGSMEQQSMLSKIAISLAKVGQPEQALQVASTIKRDDKKALALPSIVRSLAKAGQYDQAKKVASTIKDDSLKGTAFVYLAVGLAETGKIADAVQVVSAIEQRDAIPARWFSETVMVLTRAKQYNPALQMANAITSENEKAWILAQLANNLVEAGQTELASQAINPALEIVEATRSR